jgi:predicted ATPase/class 3 adenylate cyclase
VRQLPTGTVTLLFTDIEGSTKLLQELVERYSDVLTKHRRLLRDAFQRHGGVEVDTQGDAFFYAFSEAEDAVAAAAGAQEALAEGPVRVRIGIHTGAPTATEDGYLGMDVHLAARIMSAGHGGQVLVSEQTRAARSASDNLLLSDLGEHKLKDIGGPIWLHQLGSEPFPPLKTISNTNLPRPASSFVGRDRELEDVQALLREGLVRLLTLTGPGGSGKTRLAIEAAAELVGEYPNGVFWVGLAALRDPDLVTETIAQTLGAKEGLAEYVGERELLLLLDNLEQVVAAGAELAALLESCPNLRLLVTSRELLRVRGEVEFPVPPLVEAEAVSLFCERARLEPSEEVAELCRRLDNLPLAVELAAARTRALTPAQILERLSQRLDLLTGGRDADPRQQTLRATIEWSYDLLSEEEQQLFRYLSVFAGGCTIKAAEQVADADLDSIQSLVEKSLLRFTDGRYWMLETIREFSDELLAKAGELEGLKSRHTRYVLRLVADVETSGGTGSASSGLAAELDNFRAALAWAEGAGEIDSQLDLVGRSWPFWWYRGSAAEGLAWVESALARCEGEQDERRAKVLTAGAMFAYRRGDLDRLKAFAEDALAIARGLSEERHSIWPLIFLGIWAGEVGDLGVSTKHYEEAITLAKRADEPRLVGAAMNNLGVVAVLQRDYARAATLYESALAISTELDTEDRALEAINLAWCLDQMGRTEEATRVVEEGLALAQELDNPVTLADGLIVLAELAHKAGHSVLSARLFGVGLRAREEAGEPAWGAHAEEDEGLARSLQATLGEDEYARAFASGQKMSVDDALEAALRFTSAGVGRAPDPASID